MRAVLTIILFLMFAYSLGLVLVNNTEVAVNLLFSQAPAMNLGLLLIICLVLGIVIGLLLSVLVFKVVQNKWEINRLHKENAKLQHKLTEANITIDRQAHAIGTDTAATPSLTASSSRQPTPVSGAASSSTPAGVMTDDIKPKL